MNPATAITISKVARGLTKASRKFPTPLPRLLKVSFMSVAIFFYFRLVGQQQTLPI